MGVQLDDAPEESRLLAKSAPRPDATGRDFGVGETQQWSTGLFDCFDQPGGGALGCVSLLMPCVQYGVLAETLNKDAGLPCAGSFGSSAGAFFCLDVLASLAHVSLCPGVSIVPTSAVLHYQMRRHLRAKYDIQGSWQRDLCTAWWCGPCALAQETREVAIRSAAAAAAASTAGVMAAAGVGGGKGAGAQQQAPGQMAMLGNLLLPAHYVPPAPSTAAAPAVAAVAADVAMPVTGVPVVPAPPAVAVATVTLQRGNVVAEPK
ncbi:hypothetical protein HYH02_003322 [Chlamydomonas schloesseri]|uniref:Uncharacterized protein n=1 Tax=Chlamydomonas schloesseri TaxID=2026947 RepID=A0A835WS32_9CHLO|nr:hypothetical protein HYH02_003322 [Chlamydomonas schloesseri]|eukprot:KAG2452298.1 hypothetical protein HYH02_003322 [Chlamydomonas schloesseri]